MSVSFNKQVLDAVRSKRPVWRLRRLMGLARERKAEAEFIGWPALAASWEAEIQRVTGLLEQAKGTK